MSFHLKRIIRLASKEEKAMTCCRYIGGLFILSGHGITPKMAVMGDMDTTIKYMGQSDKERFPEIYKL